MAELVSKWVGETGKNINKIFANAKSKDAILVFDEAEGLFGSRQSSGGSTSRHDNLNVGLLLQYIENFTGICVVITNMKESIVLMKHSSAVFVLFLSVSLLIEMIHRCKSRSV